MDYLELVRRLDNLEEMCGVHMRNLNAALRLVKRLVDASAARNYAELVNRGRSLKLFCTDNCGNVIAHYKKQRMNCNMLLCLCR